jgi:hypothetical protein
MDNTSTDTVPVTVAPVATRDELNPGGLSRINATTGRPTTMTSKAHQESATSEVKVVGRVDERAPHRATRAVVDVEGHELVRELYTAFDRFNREHFAGQLAAPLILVTYTSPRAFGDHQAKDAHGLRSIVRIHPRTLERGALFACDIVLHEMVHVWQSEIAGDTEKGYRGHGPVFARQCNAIGKRLGLPAVGVKGRKDLPDCAQWPINVRPAGYYGNDVAEADREKNTCKPKAKGERGDTPDAVAIAVLVCEQIADKLEANELEGPIAELRTAARFLRCVAPDPIAT